jgi:hypothetical protein
VPDGWKPQDGFQIYFEVWDQDKTNQLLSSGDGPLQQTKFKIPAGTLAENNVYKVYVSVERIADDDGEEQLFKKEEKEEEFRTGTLPTRPLLTVNPESGIMYETDFSIELKGSPGEELSYIVLGVLSDESEIRLTDEYAPLDEAG